MLRYLVLATMLLAAGLVQAQNSESPKLTMQSLLRSGFQIMAMQYLNQSMVFTLQRHSVAYVCDTTLNGETKICIRLQ